MKPTALPILPQDQITADRRNTGILTSMTCRKISDEKNEDLPETRRRLFVRENILLTKIMNFYR